MFLPKPSESGSFEPTPAGTFIAICYRFIDRGTQVSEYMGDKKTRREVMITWELPTELMSDGRPFSASKTYTFSTHEKANFRKDLESWRGRAFADEDFEGPNAFNTKNLLGKPCVLSITHEARDGKTFAKVSSVGKAIKGMDVPAQVNPSVYLALVRDEFDPAIYGSLSDKLKTVIAQSPEYQTIMRDARHHDDPGNGFAGHDEDLEPIPF